jgi:type II secretory pathway pseudopilin PulG
MTGRAAAERGLSLVEATIILAVMATLSAIMAPTISDWIGSARLTRAHEDSQNIAQAIQSFITDTGESKFLRVAKGSGTAGQPPADRLDPHRVDLLVGDGDIAPLGPGVSGETFWTQAVNDAAVDTLVNHLVENTPGSSSANRYRTPSDIATGGGGGNIDFARSESGGFNAPYSWRGPYIKGPVDPDPWGYRYAVNVAFLDPSPQGTVSGVTTGFALADYPRLDVFVLSAGPDREIDTRSAQDGAVPGDDDILFVVSPNAR